jgi:hypothetical protein
MAKLDELPMLSPVAVPADNGNFSLVLGGPLYQLYLRTRLARPPLDLLSRRVIGLSLISWFPLLVLSVLGGRALGGVAVPFLRDVEPHTRFLVALPLLIMAEVFVHDRIGSIVRQFLSRGIIVPEDQPRFDALIASTMRLRNSMVLEVVLVVLVYTLAHWVWKQQLSLALGSWYTVRKGAATQLTMAGYWYAFISLPVLRFIVFRWYFRLFLWYRFLWKVARLPLHLKLFHPDRAGGLGFLSGSVIAFAPVLLAHTVFLAGFIGDRIWHTGATLPSFKMEIVGAMLFLMLLVLAPLGFFVIPLIKARRTAGREYGILASHYVDDFRSKWIEGDARASEPLLGTRDIQSLADLGDAYNVVSEMRILPFGKKTILRLVIILVVPLLPLTLTIIPLEQMVDRLIKLAF